MEVLMVCQRCGMKEARYRTYSDILDIEVCETCAREAQQLGIAVEVPGSKESARSSRAQERDVEDCATSSSPVARVSTTPMPRAFDLIV
jgi:hypothetical protein